MPRERRSWEPGDVLSIVGRTHEGRPIFVTEDDRRYFVDRLRSVFRPEVVDLLAWALLLNHFHLVIRVGDVPPGELFRRLMTPVAQRERRRRGDHGAVWGDRYWSKLVRDDGGLFALLLYVLGNPVHHRVVPSAEALERYPWTAYPEILGLAEPGLVVPSRTLALIHPDEAAARAALREGMGNRVVRWQAERDGVDLCEEPGCRGAIDLCGRVHLRPVRRRAVPPMDATGSAADDASGVAATAEQEHRQRVRRAAALAAIGWGPADLVDSVCERIGADRRLLLERGRAGAESAARALIAHVACDGAGVPVQEVAELLRISSAAVVYARHRGAAILAAEGWSIDGVLDSSREPAGRPRILRGPRG